jgi:hypothetical protein
MSAATAWEGLRERFLTVAGLQDVILGEPPNVLATPMIYTVFERFERDAEASPPSSSALTIMRYRFRSRVLIRWQDNPDAELQVLAYVNAVPFAITSDPHLGGRIASGGATTPEGVTLFVTIGGVTYRAIEFTYSVVEKGARSDGL